VAQQRGEIIISSGAAAANALGLTTQVPVRSVYLTSGRSRTMNLGKLSVELKYGTRWQLLWPTGRRAWRFGRLHGLDPRRPRRHYRGSKRKLPPAEFGELVAAAPQFPTWLARCVGRAAHG
jgi:hypothetical protein